MTRVFAVFAALLLLTSTTGGQEAVTLGPQVGDKVPDFTLPEEHGTPRPLASLMGPKGLMLVFTRSADW